MNEPTKAAVVMDKMSLHTNHNLSLLGANFSLFLNVKKDKIAIIRDVSQIGENITAAALPLAWLSLILFKVVVSTFTGLTK